MNIFANETHIAFAARILRLHHHAVAHLHLSGLGDFHDFACGFMTEVISRPIAFEALILGAHRHDVNLAE